MKVYGGKETVWSSVDKIIMVLFTVIENYDAYLGIKRGKHFWLAWVRLPSTLIRLENRAFRTRTSEKFENAVFLF